MDGWDTGSNDYSSSWNVMYAGERWTNSEDRDTEDYDYPNSVDDLDEAGLPPGASQQQVPDPHPLQERRRDDPSGHHDRRPRGETGSTHYRPANRSEQHDGSRGGDGRSHRSGRDRRDGGYSREDDSTSRPADRSTRQGSGSRGDGSRDHPSRRGPRRERRNSENRDQIGVEPPPRRATRSDSQYGFDGATAYRLERGGRDGRQIGGDNDDDAPRARPAPVPADPTMGHAYGGDHSRYDHAEAPSRMHRGDDVPLAVSPTRRTPLEMPQYGPYVSDERDETVAGYIQQQLRELSLDHRRESASTMGAESALSPGIPRYDQSSPPTSPASSWSQMPPPGRHRRRCNPAQPYESQGYDPAQVIDGRGSTSDRAYDDYQPQTQPHVQPGASASTRHRKRSSISEEFLPSSPRAVADPGAFSMESPFPLSPPPPPPPPARRQMTWDPMLSRGEAPCTPGDSNASQPGSLFDTRVPTPKRSSRVRESPRDETSGKGSKKRRKDGKDDSPVAAYVYDQYEAHRYRQPREEYPRRP